MDISFLVWGMLATACSARNNRKAALHLGVSPPFSAIYCGVRYADQHRTNRGAAQSCLCAFWQRGGITGRGARPGGAASGYFEGSQYVDSRGCVYSRAQLDGQVKWVPRVTQGREVVCGFEPTISTAPRRNSDGSPQAEGKIGVCPGESAGKICVTSQKQCLYRA